VGLSFMLLDRGRLSLANLETTFGDLPLIRRIGSRYFDGETSRITREVVEALMAAQAVEMADGWLLPAGRGGAAGA
jgi:hypothetical protein